MTYRDRVPFALAASVLTTLAAAGTTHAQMGTPQVTVDGSPVSFAAQPPLYQGGRVLVPLRGVMEKLGAYVRFDPQAQSVIALRGGTQITLPIGGHQATVGNRTVSLDVPAQIVNGTTLVPLRFVAEALGAQVGFNANQNLVSIMTQGGASSAVQEPPLLNPPPAQAPGERTVSGSVVTVYDETIPPRLVVRVMGNNGPKNQTIPVRDYTRVILQRTGRPEENLALRNIRAGDRVNVLMRGDGSAIAVNVVRNGRPGRPAPSNPAPGNGDMLQGRFDSFRKTGTDRYVLKMRDGREIELRGDTPVLFRNQPMDLADLRDGDVLMVRVNPQTGRASRVLVTRTQ